MRRFIYRYSVLRWGDPAYTGGREYEVVHETNYLVVAIVVAVKYWTYHNTDSVAVSRNAKE